MKRVAAICLVLLLTFAASSGKSGAAEQLLRVSTPELKLRVDESVHAFSCQLKGGTMVSVSRIPKMWSLTITNGNADTSDLTAYAIVGAAEFREMDLGFFKNFLLIQRPNPPGKYDLPFDITVSLLLFANPEGTRERKITFSRGQLVFVQRARVGSIG